MSERIEILAHRGLWDVAGEKNSSGALFKALDFGFGIETDVRDLNGKLVISHDIPVCESELSLENLFEYYASNGHIGTLALNIKSDGLQQEIKKLLKKYAIKNYFVFDMSIPDTLGYLSQDIRTYIRCSELEDCRPLIARAHGVWLDELTAEWIDVTTLTKLGEYLSPICIVSSELHGRTYTELWRNIKEALDKSVCNSRLMICTDLPDDARKYFNDNN